MIYLIFIVAIFYAMCGLALILQTQHKYDSNRSCGSFMENLLELIKIDFNKRNRLGKLFNIIFYQLNLVTWILILVGFILFYIIPNDDD